MDGATGWVQTQSVLSPASPFLKDGWYRAIILAYDDGEHQVQAWTPWLSDPGWESQLLAQGLGARPSLSDDRVGSGSGRARSPPALLSAASPPCTATGTLSIEILEVNDHAPELSPSSGSLCSEPDQGSGLLLGATDEDLPPHGAPFHFQLSPRVPELARNWSLSQINSELCPPPGGRVQTWDLGGHSRHGPAGYHPQWADGNRPSVP